MTAPVSYVAVCTEFDEAEACTETVWMPYASGVVPSLSIEAATDLGLAIALLWGVAWGIKMVKRVLIEAH